MSLASLRKRAGKTAAKPDLVAAPIKRGYALYNDAIWIGIVQGLCLPFRGFSRSGATISTGLLRGLQYEALEEFSFALAVVLTPAAINEDLLHHVAPLGWAHIGLTGDYVWSAGDQLRAGTLRPLRQRQSVPPWPARFAPEPRSGQRG